MVRDSGFTKKDRQWNQVFWASGSASIPTQQWTVLQLIVAMCPQRTGKLSCSIYHLVYHLVVPCWLCLFTSRNTSVCLYCTMGKLSWSIYHLGKRWRQDFQRTVPLPSLPPPPNKPPTHILSYLQDSIIHIILWDSIIHFLKYMNT